MPRNWKSLDDFEVFLNAGGVVESDDAMPDEYRRAVFRFIENHANSELMAGLTQRDWIPRTPGLRQKMQVMAKVQDEFGHAQVLYAVAADLGSKTRTQMVEELLAGRSRFHSVFHHQAESWSDQVVIMLLVDAAALAAQQAVFKNCSYGPYKRALKRIIVEENLHASLGLELFGRMAGGTEKQRAMIQQSIDNWWWRSLRLFGPDSEPDDRLARWHIKSERNEVMRDRWVQRFVPLLAEHRFTVPDANLRYDDGRQRWVIGPIDWSPVHRTRSDRGSVPVKRIDEASGDWQRTAWVRRAMERPQLVGADVSAGVGAGVKTA